MEIPTARVLEDGVMRIGYAQADPYRWYTGGMGVFPGLEFSGRYTEMTNLPSNMPGFGADKDKAFDLKYQILPESKRFPALAVGINDFHGTELFKSEYIVLSRQIFPLDFTIGFGSKRLKGPVSLPLYDKLGIFGGVEWALNKRVNLMVEYNPIEYEKDPAKAVPEGADSHINLGLRAKVVPGLDIGISWQRGNTLGFMCHILMELDKPLRPKKPDPPFRKSVNTWSIEEEVAKSMVEKTRIALKAAGFQDISVYSDGKVFTAEIENNKYFSNQKAAGRALRILLAYKPDHTKKLVVIFKRRLMPFLKVSVHPNHFKHYLLEQIDEEVFSELITYETITSDMSSKEKNIVGTKADNSFDFSFGIKPNFETYFNDPSGAFKYRLGVQPYMTASLWKGAAATVRYDIPFYSDISSSNESPPNTIRGDSWEYMGEEWSLNQLILDQSFRLSKKTWGRFSIGYLERMYAGFSTEALTFLGDGNLALGIEYDWVKKREPGTQIDLMDLETHTYFGNIYYTIRNFDITLHARYGRFMAGDRGWLFTASRKFDAGHVVGFWYSFTDTNDFSDYNKDYHEKGVFLSLPVKMFTGSESRTRYKYSMVPWSRDVGQTVNHLNELFHFSDLMPYEFKDNISEIKE